uniref:Uncharacterized protein n=1 Tax=Caenorhabditis japonica TaxID=281687 RepID=A0A8R1ENI5_CAEJA
MLNVLEPEPQSTWPPFLNTFLPRFSSWLVTLPVTTRRPVTGRPQRRRAEQVVGRSDYHSGRSSSQHPGCSSAKEDCRRQGISAIFGTNIQASTKPNGPL